MSLYLAHFGLESPPFRITPGTEFFYEGARRGETVNALIYAVESGEGMIKVVGEVGSGKTMLCRVLMERLPKHVQTVYLAVPSLTRDEILDAIADDLGLAPEGRVTQRIKALQQRLVELHAAGQRVLLIIDEAHAMPVTTLEEIRLLSNLETGQDKLLQIVMFGQPELDSHLAAPNMRQLRERITQNLALAPLPAADIGEYVDYRLRRAGYKGPRLFSAESLAVIGEASEGLSRRINIFADKTLLAAFAAGTHTVTADHARAAIADMPVQPMPKPAKPRPLWFWPLLAAAGMALAGVGFWIGLASRSMPQPAMQPAFQPAAQPAMQPVAPSVQAPQSATSVPAPASQPPAQSAPPTPAKQAAPYPARGSADRIVQRAELEATARRQQQELSDGRARVLAATPGSHFAQLWAKSASDSGLPSYAAMLAAGAPQSAAWQVPLGNPRDPRIGLLMGPYANRALAQAALTAIPRELAIHTPQVRAAEAIKAELR
jgi:MSHA biogenesis protein MshM